LALHEAAQPAQFDKERETMKHLLLTTALIAAGSAGAVYAQAAQTTSPYMSEMSEGQIHASDFLGMRVYAAADSGEMTEAEGASDSWEDIGEINDVIMSREGQVEAVLIDIGGFLGIGERQVAVNLDQVKFVSDSSTEDGADFFLVLNADPATLGDAPAFSAEESAEADAEMSDAPATDMAATDEPTTEADDNMAAAGDNLDQAGENMEQAGENVADAAENTGEAIENGAEATAEAADDAVTTDKESTDMAATDETAPVAGSTDMAEADDAATPGAVPMSGTPVENSYLTAENLDGARVYDANDKWVGEISELIVTEQGEITDAIVDVGGFLGIGEKPVALKLTDLQILRQDGSEEVRIYTAMAEEELEAMPEFEKQ
jgi:sporulation protein YlmC with PRC-barrel domain